MLLHAEELPKRILQYTRRQKVEWDNQQYWRISFQTETCTEVGTEVIQRKEQQSGIIKTNSE